MCGIAATFAYGATAAPVQREELLRVREAMATRGPDGSGLWLSEDRRVGLAHRRLAIIDVSERGAQPMSTPDGTLVVSFNGEIYNYRELRAGLEARGCDLRTESDTEVLLHLYREHGPALLERLRGMYAFALWDVKKQGLLLARDPFGIKPLYVADDGQTLRAASQVKAMVAGGGIDTRPDPAGHVGYFLWGHVPEPVTLLRGVSSVPAGGSLWVTREGRPVSSVGISVSRLLASGTPPPASQGAEWLREALLDSVTHHLIADVPVGIFLSAGVDSAVLTLLATESGADVRTVTLGFAEFAGSSDDEVPVAEEVARAAGTRHETVIVSRDEFLTGAEPFLSAMDQPTIDGLNTYLVSQAGVRAGLKVALSGLGGDELFGGYPSFHQVPRLVHLTRPAGRVPWLGSGLRAVATSVLSRMTSPKYAGILEYGPTWSGAYLLRRGLFMPWELPSLLGADVVREGWQRLETLARLEETSANQASDRARVAALEMTWYMRNQLLRDTDWASMAHSLEVRVPFLDVELLLAASPRLRDGNPPGKADLAAAAGSRLPASVSQRRKTGFLTPVGDWIRESIAGKRFAGRGLRGWARYVYERQWENGSLPLGRKAA